MSKGIIILALGHRNYFHMAYNLIVSIRLRDKDIPVTLFTDGNYVNEFYAGLFSDVKAMPSEYFTHKNRFAPLKAKTFLYDITPYDETLFLDADMIWVNNEPASNLINSIDCDFTIANYGFTPLDNIRGFPGTIWCKPEQLKEAYQFTTGNYYSYSSEVVFFRKTEAVHNYFEWVKDIWRSPLIEPRKFADGVPDEFAFAVASLMTGIYPHVSPFTPSYWAAAQRDHKIPEPEIAKRFYLYSIGGNALSDTAKKYYNRTARLIFKEMGLQYPYQVTRDKRSYLPERTNDLK